MDRFFIYVNILIILLFNYSFSIEKKTLQYIGVLENFIKYKNINDIVTNDYYKHKDEYMFSTKNISQFNKNNLHAIVYVNHKKKILYVFIRGTKIVLSTQIFDQKDIDDCVRLQKNQSISKKEDLYQLALFLYENIPNIYKYKITISGHSLGSVCSDILAVFIKNFLLRDRYYHKINLSSITFDNPGSLHQIKDNKYTIPDIRRITSGIEFIIIQNGSTFVNSSLLHIRNNLININFLLDKYKFNDDKIHNFKSQARNVVINFFANILAKKINTYEQDMEYPSNMNFHLFENIYAGVIDKYHSDYIDKIDDFKRPVELYLLNLIEKQNTENSG
ncbi:MAG: hypothetical protein AAFO15_01095 [Pseudomonadota bacterium]